MPASRSLLWLTCVSPSLKLRYNLLQCRRDKDASLNDAEGDKKAESEMTEAEDDEDADDDKADASVEVQEFPLFCTGYVPVILLFIMHFTTCISLKI